MSGDIWRKGTLAFYDREAETYSARWSPEPYPRLTDFLTHLAPGAEVLDLGCGGGQDSWLMQRAGFQVTSVDGSAGLAAVAERRLGRSVEVMLFEDLAFEDRFAAVWANASLTHVPVAGLPDVLRRVRRALQPGGRFQATFKAGTGGALDPLGRYFSYLTEVDLEAVYAASGPWSEMTVEGGEGGAYDREAQTWWQVTNRRPS